MKLKQLSFSKIDLTAVDPRILARAVTRLELVNFVHSSTKLTDGQSEAIYATVANSDTKLRRMAVPCQNVTWDNFARAVNKMEKFYGTLSGPKAESVLAQSLVQTKLTRVIITVSKGGFCKCLLREARKTIPHLDVSKTAVYHETSAKCPNDHPQ